MTQIDVLIVQSSEHRNERLAAVVVRKQKRARPEIVSTTEFIHDWGKK
jgi:hypothetical protein